MKNSTVGYDQDPLLARLNFHSHGHNRTLEPHQTVLAICSNMCPAMKQRLLYCILCLRHFDTHKSSADPKEASKLFSVPDFVGDACKAIASRVRGAVAQCKFDDFHKASSLRVWACKLMCDKCVYPCVHLWGVCGGGVYCAYVHVYAVFVHVLVFLCTCTCVYISLFMYVYSYALSHVSNVSCGPSLVLSPPVLQNSARIIRVSVFGTDEHDKVRAEFRFSANNLVITSIDIQSVEPVDQRTRDALQKSVQLAIEITTNSQEAAARCVCEGCSGYVCVAL